MTRTKKCARRKNKPKGAKPVAAAAVAAAAGTAPQAAAAGSGHPQQVQAQTGRADRHRSKRQRTSKEGEEEVDEAEAAALVTDAQVDIEQLRQLYGDEQEGGEEEADPMMGSEEEEEKAAAGEPGTSAAAAAASSSSAATAASAPADPGPPPIASFSVLFVAPKGKYDFDLHPSHFCLHRSTFRADIPYTNVRELMLLEPHLATTQHQLLIRLHEPLYQGRTRCPSILARLDDYETTVYLDLDEQTCVEKYKGAIETQMKGKVFEVVTRVFQALSGCELTPPSTYQSKHGHTSIRCSIRDNPGSLHVMRDCFLFAPRPLLRLPFADVVSVVFRRVSSPHADSASASAAASTAASTAASSSSSAAAPSGSKKKAFDIRVVTNEKKNNSYVFHGIQRDEYESFFAFLQSHLPHVSLVHNDHDKAEQEALTNASKKRKRDEGTEEPQRPRPVKGAFALFCSEARPAYIAEHPEQDTVQVHNALRTQFSLLDAASLVKYNEQAGRYRELVQKQRDGLDVAAEGPDDPRLRKDPRSGKLVAKPAYLFYMDEMQAAKIAENPDFEGYDPTVHHPDLKAQWRALGYAGRAKYYAMAKASKEALCAKILAAGTQGQGAVTSTAPAAEPVAAAAGAAASDPSDQMHQPPLPDPSASQSVSAGGGESLALPSSTPLPPPPPPPSAPSDDMVDAAFDPPSRSPDASLMEDNGVSSAAASIGIEAPPTATSQDQTQQQHI